MADDKSATVLGPIRREVRLMQGPPEPDCWSPAAQFADPQKILELGMSFWSSRVVLTAVEFGVFTELASGPQSAHALMSRFGWHPRAADAFLDEEFVGMELLCRDQAGLYSNSRQADLFLDRTKPSYIGGLMELW